LQASRPPCGPVVSLSRALRLAALCRSRARRLGHGRGTSTAPGLLLTISRHSGHKGASRSASARRPTGTRCRAGRGRTRHDARARIGGHADGAGDEHAQERKQAEPEEVQRRRQARQRQLRARAARAHRSARPGSARCRPAGNWPRSAAFHSAQRGSLRAARFGARPAARLASASRVEPCRSLQPSAGRTAGGGGQTGRACAAASPRRAPERQRGRAPPRPPASSRTRWRPAP